MPNKSKISHFLEDDSFPPMLLIDGDWGSGKTFFIENELIGFLNERYKTKSLFFSLYGLNSISDFRDRIISLSFNESEDTTKLGKVAKEITDGLAQISGERGLGALLSGASGAYKYKLYSDFKDKVIVLDDLERISDKKVIRDVLGECLNLAERKNTKVIIVANEKKLDCSEDVEKVFVDKIKFSLSESDIFEISKSLLPTHYHQYIEEDIKLIINDLKISNIRVLKRAIRKFIYLCEQIPESDQVDFTVAYKKILNFVIRISYARFEREFTIETIKDSITSRFIRNYEKNNDEKEEYTILDNIFNGAYYNPGEEIIDYCCEGVFKFNDISYELSLPRKMTVEESASAIWRLYSLEDDDLPSVLKSLEEIIDNENNVKFYEWFKACDTYNHMLKRRMVESGKFTVNEILEKCASKEKTDFSLEDFSGKYSAENDFYCDDVKRYYALKFKEMSDYLYDLDKEDLIGRFFMSWHDVEEKINRSYSHKSFFNNISMSKFVGSLNNWHQEEVHRFCEYMKSRYRFSNIDDIFGAESEFLKDSCYEIDLIINELKFGIKVSALLDLHDVLYEAYTRISKVR
ncbi:KAP family NTPase [Aliamphritea ceti]|uniref:KAP family NTPase n=1 Tax=Aliamphritea ceti TaxID=1524258 RepID=UPI0021C39BED|nr:KAP family NTPase [Aliamphritea ceti]